LLLNKLKKTEIKTEMGYFYLKKSITNYIANYFYTKQLALSIEVIGLKKPITKLPITETKKISL